MKATYIFLKYVTTPNYEDRTVPNIYFYFLLNSH